MLSKNLTFNQLGHNLTTKHNSLCQKNKTDEELSWWLNNYKGAPEKVKSDLFKSIDFPQKYCLQMIFRLLSMGFDDKFADLHSITAICYYLAKPLSLSMTKWGTSAFTQALRKVHQRKRRFI